MISSHNKIIVRGEYKKTKLHRCQIFYIVITPPNVFARVKKNCSCNVCLLEYFLQFSII